VNVQKAHPTVGYKTSKYIHFQHACLLSYITCAVIYMFALLVNGNFHGLSKSKFLLLLMNVSKTHPTDPPHDFASSKYLLIYW